MAAPASSGPRWRIPIVIPQPYVVPPQAVRVGVPVNQTHEVNGASSSFEDARVRGFREGIEYQRNGGNRMAAKADDHGHGGGHGGIPEGAKKVLYWAAAILAIVWVLLYSADRIHQFWDPVGYRAAERARLLDERLDEEERIRMRRSLYGDGSGGYERRGGGSTRTTTGGGTGYRGQGVPSPEEIARRVPHKRTRTPVPCIDGYVKDDVTGQCDLVEWTPGPEPE